MGPYFSILIPIFNKAGQMDDCIRSIKSQTFQDFEVVFVNDGSTDSSAEELAQICAADERFRVVTHEKNSSVMTARYTGMKEARGRYILFIDSDDLYSPVTCERIHAELEKNPVDIVRFDIIEEPKMNLRRAQSFPEGVMAAYMKGKISPTVWKNCYSKAVAEKALGRIEPFYSNMAEDLFLSTVLYDCAQSFSIMNETFYHYQTGSGMSTTRKVSPKKMRVDMDSFLLVSKNLYAYVDQYCPKYQEDARELIKSNMRYIFANSLWDDDDLVNIIDCLYVLRGGETQWLYEEACREAIPAFVRKKYLLSDERMDLAGVQYEKFTWLS